PGPGVRSAGPASAAPPTGAGSAGQHSADQSGSAGQQPADQSGSAAAPPAPQVSAPAGRSGPGTPAPPGSAGDAAGGSISLDDAAAAWIKAVEGFRPRLKAMAKEAHPVRVEGDTVVVGLPSRFEKVHLPTITGDAPNIIAALSELLGRKVRLNVVLDDAVTPPAAAGPPPGPPPAPDPGSGAEAMAAEMARPPEPSGGGRGVDSPVALVIETFGASIESETVRE
ncbi:MAG TPA: hypothetical protein VHL53_24105, partial [Acidimicrobiia bacterium]|nr:hypothetical protein [Acidimicrobiia bacterium]